MLRAPAGLHSSSHSVSRSSSITAAAVGVAAAAPPRPRRCCQHSSRRRRQAPTTIARVQHSAVPISGDYPAYGGRCTLCGGSHWLGCSDEAVAAMEELLATLCEHQRLDYAASGEPDARFHLHWLFTAGPGRMLGVLLADDAQGQRVVLKAFSGQLTRSWFIPGWVGPVAGIINESPLYIKTRRVIEGMSARLAALDSQRQQQDQQQAADLSFQQQQRRLLLKRRRRCLSHHLLQQIQQSYQTTTVDASQPLSLLDVYLAYRDMHEPGIPVSQIGQDFVGMPAGVGDCCAPKLLHAAAQQGLTPVALCEVWFGSAPGTATKAKQGRAVPAGGLDPESSRQHCMLYGPCEKCAAILGTMLCTCASRNRATGGGSLLCNS